MIAVIPVAINAIAMIRTIGRTHIDRPRAIVVSRPYKHSMRPRITVNVDSRMRRRSTCSEEGKKAAERCGRERHFAKQFFTLFNNRVHDLLPAFRAAFPASAGHL